MTKTTDDFPHGTVNGYSNLGCRCDECRTAKTEYMKIRKQEGPKYIKGKPEIKPGDGDPRHGTANAYHNLKCRCADCTKAANEMKREARRRKWALQIAEAGICAGHPCDNCERCTGGECCGNDVGEAGLPLEGSWKGEWHGKVGILEMNMDEKLKCACCGDWFVNLGKHASAAHKLNADAYRATWGLKCGTPLVTDAVVEQLSKNGKKLMATGWRIPEEKSAKNFTPEQRHMISVKRENRAEYRAERADEPRDSQGKFMPRKDAPIMPRRAYLEKK